MVVLSLQNLCVCKSWKLVDFSQCLAANYSKLIWKLVDFSEIPHREQDKLALGEKLRNGIMSCFYSLPFSPSQFHALSHSHGTRLVLAIPMVFPYRIIDLSLFRTSVLLHIHGSVRVLDDHRERIWWRHCSVYSLYVSSADHQIAVHLNP